MRDKKMFLHHHHAEESAVSGGHAIDVKNPSPRCRTPIPGPPWIECRRRGRRPCKPAVLHVSFDGDLGLLISGRRHRLRLDAVERAFLAAALLDSIGVTDLLVADPAVVAALAEECRRLAEQVGEITSAAVAEAARRAAAAREAAT